MIELIVAVLILCTGTGIGVLPMRNSWRAAVGITAQVLATALVLWTVVPILAGGPVVVGEMAWGYPAGTLRVRLDALGAFFLAWSLPMTLLGSLYAVGYLKPHFQSTRNVGLHFALLNITALAFIVVYASDHTLFFLVGWELAALAAWLMVIWDYTNQKVRFAGFNYLVSTHIGLVFLVAAVMILYTHTLGWELTGFGRWLGTHPGSERNLVFLLLVASFGLKSAFFPFHSWLPRAHAAAPAHVSALMSGVIHKAGLYALIRFVFLIGQPDEWMGWFLIAFSAVSAVIGGLYTMGQRDLKRLLGYSSTENVGIAGIGIGVGCLGLSWGNATLTALGFTGALLHILNHAFFKCQLFYAAGAVYQATHTVDIEKLGGLSRLMPWTTLSFLIGGVAIAAVPPLNGFASEFVIYSGLFTSEPISSWAKVALCTGGAVLAFVGTVSALSITRAFGIVFLGSPRDPGVHAPAEVSRWMLLPMGVHAVGVVVLGVLPVLGFALVHGATAQALALLPGPDTGVLQAITDALTRIGLVSGSLGLVIAAAVGWRLAAARLAARRVSAIPRSTITPPTIGPTWGCGYSAPNSRMQYTGSSFSSDIQDRYTGVLVTLRRQKSPLGYFPTDSYLITHCVDSVERRLFAVIKRGDASASELSGRLAEDNPRIAFTAALIAIVMIAGLVVLAGGELP